MTPTCQQAY